MREVQLSRTSAGLGGMATALLLVGLVVQQARAATPCSDCMAWADQQALARCDTEGLSHSSPQCRGYRQGWAQWCYQNNWNGSSMPPCPDDQPPLAVCESAQCSTFNVNGLCPEPYQSRGGGRVCTGACDNQACGSNSNPGKCNQASVVKIGDTQPAGSNCMSGCICQ